VCLPSHETFLAGKVVQSDVDVRLRGASGFRVLGNANFHFTAWQKRSKQRIRDAKRFNVLEGSRRDDTADNRRLPVDLRSIHRGSNASPVHFTQPIRDAACSDNGHKTDTRVAVLRVPCRSLISQNAGVKRVSGPSSRERHRTYA